MAFQFILDTSIAENPNGRKSVGHDIIEVAVDKVLWSHLFICCLLSFSLQLSFAKDTVCTVHKMDCVPMLLACHSFTAHKRLAAYFTFYSFWQPVTVTLHHLQENV